MILDFRFQISDFEPPCTDMDRGFQSEIYNLKSEISSLRAKG
jgi:hypothetical protein